MPAQPFSRRHLWSLAATLLTAGFFTTRPSWAQSPRAVRYRATIDAADAKSISLTTRSGQQLTMAVASDTVILAIVPFKLEDIKPGSYIGSAAMPQRDGTLRALEVHVFPESMRGAGEGYGPFDLEPRSTMTNGTVGSVTTSGTAGVATTNETGGAGTSGTGRTLMVRYPDGEKTIVVPPDTPVVMYEPGSPALLVAGAHCIVSGIEASDGRLSATRIAVGKNGLVPPM
jgi:hypothetical protein